MSTVRPKKELRIPDRMQVKLTSFQKQIWLIKLAEGLLAATFGLLISYLVLFSLDRFYDTSKFVRWGILLTGSIGLGIWFPLVCHKWIWRSRKLEQVAKLLRIQYPRLGDHLLGILELVKNSEESSRSIDLCQAALAQVDEEIKDRNFEDAVPFPKHRKWAMLVGIPALLTVFALVYAPAASTNAFARWFMPWKNIERYTFTQIESLPKQIIVPIAENTFLNTHLKNNSRWNPSEGSAYINGNRIGANNKDGKFTFKLPSLKADSKINLVIGDVRKQIAILPKARPELVSMQAEIALPAYLQRTEKLTKDIRGGSLSIVQGSSVALRGDATRKLKKASLDNVSLPIQGKTIETTPVFYKTSTLLSFRWEDKLGLSAKTPLKIKIRVNKDANPTLTCRKLEKQRVMLEKDVLSFNVSAGDDFGIKKIGMEWKGSGTDEHESPVSGEKIISAGNPNSTELDALATFSPRREAIKPQTIQLRLFVEDYFPNRERIYSPTYTLFILSEDEHAIWLTSQLNRWYKNTLESFEREKNLRSQNEILRNLSDEKLEQAHNRRKIESQVAAEKSQARRLKALTKAGEKLTLEASRNDKFDAVTLENLSEILRSLKDISENRMPSVANLLSKSANAQSMGKPGKSKPSDSGKSVSDNHASPGTKPGSPDAKKTSPKDQGKKTSKPDKTPSISMQESSMEKAAGKKGKSGSSKPKKKKFGLPTVSLSSKTPSKKKPSGGPSPVKKAINKAIDEQDKLLAEFQKVAEELQKIISNLEGSTFVKRLKAISRKHTKIAQDVNETSVRGFGLVEKKVKKSVQERAKLLAKREEKYTDLVNYIQDDLEAYVNRVPDGRFKEVLAEMKKEELADQINQVAGKITYNQPGSAIAQAELLADTFDRWAEQLVGPPCSCCSKPGNPKNLPPSIVLEVMKILAAEIALREETRGLQQARPQLKTVKYESKTRSLVNSQEELADRTEAVIEKILELPGGEKNFGKEIKQLKNASNAMWDAAEILETPDTGPKAMGAETEAIEWLLQAKRSGKGGGGGGGSPGDGSRHGDDTNTTALALLGETDEDQSKVIKKQILQATGKTGQELPEEFSRGLDKYFEMLERQN